MIWLILIVLAWFGFGVLSLLILRKENLQTTYRVFLVMEGFVGFLFLILFRSAFVEGKTDNEKHN